MQNMRKYDIKINTTEKKISGEEKDENNGWTLELAKTLRYYSYNSAELSWKYGRDAKCYNKFNNTISLVIAFSNALSTVGIVSIMNLLDDLENLPAIYTLASVTIVLNLISTLGTVYQKIKNYEYKIAECSEKSNKYSDMHMDIRNQFALPVDHRYNGLTLLEYTSKRFSELNREGLFIRDSTNSKWEKQMSNKPNLKDNLLILPPEYENDFYTDKSVELNIMKNNDENKILLKK